MKALVTGANGQLGRALVALAPAGWDCVGATREQLDLADENAIRDAIGTARPDIVINAGAYTAVDKAESEEELATSINATAVRVLAQATRDVGGHLVHVSTDFVFDGTSSTPYRPDAARRPLSAYGRSKAAGEDFAGEDATIVRTSWVYDAGGANFVRTMLRLMRERDELSVVEDQIGSPTWAAGLAETLWAFAALRQPGVFHHRDAGVASWYDFAVAIGEEASAIGLLDREIPVIPISTADYPTPAARPAFSVLEDSDTRALIGDRPAHWRENLKRMLQKEKTIG